MRKGRTQYTGPSRAAINRSSLGPGWLDLHTPYVLQFVEDLKTVVQPSHRKWDPVQLVWHVNELFIEELIGLCKMYFDEVTTDLIDQKPSSENIFLPVFEALKGNPDMPKVYRALANACHPDHGGSNDMMTRLNQAYEVSK